MRRALKLVLIVSGVALAATAASAAYAQSASDQSQRLVVLMTPAADFSLIVTQLPLRISSRQLPSALTVRCALGTRLPSLIS